MNKRNIVIFFVALLAVAACTPKAAKLFSKGEKEYNMAAYQTAIENYKQAIAKGYHEGSVANYRIAEALKKSNRIHEAEQYYAKAVNSNLKEDEAVFWYAYSLKANGKYENAKEQFKRYIAQGSNFDLVNRAKREVENIEAISHILENPAEYEVRNLEELNTSYAEYSPFMSKGKLYYTSNKGITKMHTANNTGFTDIFEFIFDGVDRFSGQAKPLPNQINTNDAHEATPIFSKDGKTMYFSRGNTGNKKGRKEVDIYMSRLQNGVWSEPELLPFCGETSWDSSPALSPDGKKLYFASNRDDKDAQGGIDIYVATIDSTGKWGNVRNLGAPVNTRGNDMFPYIDDFGNFYFSSDGHPTLGSLDIFKIAEDENGDMVIKNLGRPINSPYEDFALYAIDSVTGYFSSNRPEGKGDDDIYEYNAYKNAIYVVQGVTVSEDSNLVISNALITITNMQGDTVARITSDENGKFTYPAEPEQEYNVTASREGFLFYESKFSTVGKTVDKKKLKPGDNEVVIEQTIAMKRKAVGIVFVIDNVYYDFDKWDIRPDAEISLNTVVDFLQKNPDINIELSSHTDERGAAKYNRDLSQKRAQSAVNYIISKGIDAERIVAKGYGKDKPLIRNAQTEEEHQKNRRTEVEVTNISDPNIKIIKKGEEDLLTTQP